ncbi:AAA family ATPase [Oceanisphaera avium]|uniref:AAA+ ATPase domain-containing protein n=1 Tax=Oceanisphaera avium TaxID=1903694 RepID=A0A1Y0D008_9GAMM|nr:ATP-binding protein [Oceanisphaera avium]ART80921.1 hypothetical protein CBP12_12780 [Oceanisphaera avium]
MKDLSANLYQALGFRWRRLNQSITPCLFNPALCATDMPLAPMIEHITRSKRGRLCLFGAAGSGKTALAHHLAAALNTPFITKHASTLIEPHLGAGVEKLAMALAEASDALLLIEQAECLFNYASQSGHDTVSQINELLIQVAQTNTVVVMTAHDMTSINSALLSGFDFKIGFHYFNAEQAWRYFNMQLGLSLQQHFYEQRVSHLYCTLETLRNLTPRDFAKVVHQHQLIGKPLSPESLLAGLQQEHSLKTVTQNKSLDFLV